MLDAELIAPVESTVRSVASAGRALRLYPPGSPLPGQSLDTAMSSLAGVLSQRSTLVLDVARDGFTCRGTSLQSGVGADLSELLRSHGIASLIFSPSCSKEDLLAFLTVVMRSAETIRAEGGVMRALDGIVGGGIRVVTVNLTVTVTDALSGQADEFFREVALDPEKLATWLSAATSGDSATLAEGLVDLRRAVGPEEARFLSALAEAFEKQENQGADALLALGMEAGGAAPIIAGMLANLQPNHIAAALLSGRFGKNMLALSDALTRLPMGGMADAVTSAIRPALPSYGRAEKEAALLDHMLDVRSKRGPEASLTNADATFAERLADAAVTDEALDASRADVRESVAHTAARSIPTMLTLLDQQRDFPLYVKTLDALAAIVPTLVAEGELHVAGRVLKELSDRMARTAQPWPELTRRLTEALAAASGPATMGPLLDEVLANPSSNGAAHGILRLAGEAGRKAFVEEAISRRDERALDVAESLVGRRMLEMLRSAAASAAPGQLAPLVARLAGRHDTDSAQVIDNLLKRRDEATRIAVAEALGTVSNPAVVSRLAALLRDPAEKVATTAAKALSRAKLPGACGALVQRLEELDVDNGGFVLGREIIGSLSQMTDPQAAQALRKLAARKALIKRGRFLDVQRLANEALRIQTERTGR